MVWKNQDGVFEPAKSFSLSCSASKFIGGYKNFVMLSPGATSLQSLVHGSNPRAAH